MLSSAWFPSGCRDRLHQTLIEAQPPPWRRCGALAPRPRNDSVPSYRPIHEGGLAGPETASSYAAGSGEGQSSPLHVLRILDVITTEHEAERERVSNPSEGLPGVVPMDRIPR